MAIGAFAGRWESGVIKQLNLFSALLRLLRSEGVTVGSSIASAITISVENREYRLDRTQDVSLPSKPIIALGKPPLKID